MATNKPVVVDSDEDSGIVFDVPPVVRHPFSRVKVSVKLVGGKTHQSFKASCCVNRIMQSIERTGVIPPDPLGRVPNYGDVSHLNLPLDQLIARQREVGDKLVKYTADQKEKIRLARIAKRKKDEEDLAAYRAHLAAVGKNNTTESQSS